MFFGSLESFQRVEWMIVKLKNVRYPFENFDTNHFFIVLYIHIYTGWSRKLTVETIDSFCKIFANNPVLLKCYYDAKKT